MTHHYRLDDPTRFLDATQQQLVENTRHLLNAGPDIAEEHLKKILSQIKGDVVVIEFARGVQHGHEYIRGALLRDADDNVVAYVTNALIGYEGSGPILSRHILEMFGFSKEAFDAVNRAAYSDTQHYDIIVEVVWRDAA